jgi:hypothetical protein
MSTCKRKIDQDSALEDRVATLENQMNAHFGYEAVKDILNNPKQIPNRRSVEFVPYKTQDA